MPSCRAKNSPLPLSVVGGTYRGLKLHSPGAATHPMGAREKNALFNMAAPAGKRVLDLYAGSGALGLEALSRGATSVTFVENSSPATATIRQNLAKLPTDVLSQTSVVTTSAQDYLASSVHAAHIEPFDLIIADPPYEHFSPAEFASVSALLAPDGCFILSSPAALSALDLPGLTILKTHTYAAARLTLYHAL